MNFKTRKRLYQRIEKSRNTKVILFVTGTRTMADGQISSDCINVLIKILDKIHPTDKISLILQTNGGSIDVAWQLANLLKIFSNRFEVIIINRAMSAGTLIAIGANIIIMTKQAVIGPIDPSLFHVLGPRINSAIPESVSVEAFNGYFEYARKELKIESSETMGFLLSEFSKQLHPLVIGEISRSRTNVRLYADKLLKENVPDSKQRKKIIGLLCSDLGSHSYTINRREAKEIGLPIEAPDADFYGVLNGIYQSYSEQLLLDEPFYLIQNIQENEPKQHELIRGLIESPSSGSFEFVDKFEVKMSKINGIEDYEKLDEFQKWREINENG